MSDGIRNKGRLTIANSAVAVGAHAQASNAAGPAAPVPLEEAELRSELARLAVRLRSVADELADPDTVTEAADEVDEELAQPAAGWRRILDVLQRVGPAVASLARLAGDVASIESAVQSMITH
jgi:hypothetical protein